LGSSSLRFRNVYTTGSITAATYTQGSILFACPSGLISQNNSKFFWDNANTDLGIGTSTGTSTLTVQGSGSTNPFSVVSSSGSSLLSVLSNGNVGLGTSNPSFPFQIKGN